MCVTWATMFRKAFTPLRVPKQTCGSFMCRVLPGAHNKDTFCQAIITSSIRRAAHPGR